jgi:predicted RNA methylase
MEGVHALRCTTDQEIRRYFGSAEGRLGHRIDMAGPRTAYELSESQVTTPERVVKLFWDLTKQHRKQLKSVLDLGAGDCRFGVGGNFTKYTGVEIDKRRIANAKVPRNGEIVHGCVFRHQAGEYDACIGNPPYARHHDIETSWKDRTVVRLERELSVSLNKHCNLYIYFFCLALLKAREDGLVALVIPYEWVSRPSAKALRDYIREQRWNVSVYRFQKPIFEGVMTTASVSIVDKARQDGLWAYHDITAERAVVNRPGVTDSKNGVLEYAKRGQVWGLRGLSPGSQKIFTLTEGERVRAGLRRRTDVVPCVTSLKNVPRALELLSSAAFEKNFVESGDRCWLIRSDKHQRSDALESYLKAIPEEERSTYTCENQTPWFNYKAHPVPQILFSSGFTEFGPKVLINSVSARAIGSVWGIHSRRKLPLRRLQTYLLSINFERRVVAHAEKLKKVEVRQLNAVLNTFEKRERKNARKSAR